MYTNTIAAARIRTNKYTFMCGLPARSFGLLAMRRCKRRQGRSYRRIQEILREQCQLEAAYERCGDLFNGGRGRAILTQNRWPLLGEHCG
jgi:hypothetical protein